MQIRPDIGAGAVRGYRSAPETRPIETDDPPQVKDHALNLDPRRQRLFGPDGQALAFPTDGSVFTLGRLPGSTVLVDGSSVSRHHADGKWQDGQLWIRDRSSHGTLINGQAAPPNEWKAVPDGAKVRLGQEPPLVLGVGGSNTIMVRLDKLQKAPESSPFHLRLAQGGALEIPADGRVVEVGRQPGSEVHFETSSVSRKHAQLRWQGGQLQVRDVGSTYGTFVNGQKLEGQDWVSVPQGGQLQFGLDEKSRAVFEAKNPLVVTFFGDGSVPDIGGEVKAQPRRFERALANNNSPAVVRGMVAKGSLAKEAGMTALPVAMGGAGAAGLVVAGVAAVGAVLGGPLSIPLALWGVSMAGTGAFGAWTARHMFKGGLQALKERFKEAAPTQASPWRHVQHMAVSQGPKIGQFEKLWKENLSTWPTSRHVVFISGHGTQSGVAGLNYADVGKTVKGAEAIFLDACNGAQIESLVKLTDSARVAVASEHTVRGYGFPLDDMFGRTKFPDDARALGAALVQSANQSQPSQSLVAVDLHALRQQLLPRLDQLGRSLLHLRQHGYDEIIDTALKNSETTNAGGLSKKVDMGSFLANLAKVPAMRQACPELGAAEAAFNKTILSMTGHGTISFDRQPTKDLPEGWRAFLKAS